MTLRDISINENRSALQRPVSHRACAMAASHRVDNSMLRPCVAMQRVLCRERRRRQPPKVSGPLPAHNPTAFFEGAPMTLRDISMHENRRALPRRVSHRACAMAASHRVENSMLQPCVAM
jgi:hypothetical protein